MAFWDDLKGKVYSMNQNLKTKISQFKNADFANAAMAMCALVSAADGNIVKVIIFVINYGLFFSF